MTVGVEVPYKRYVYSGPGDYTYDFKVYKDEDLVLTYQDTVGLITVLSLGVDYTVTRDGDDQGGTCHLTYAPTDGSLEIRRVLPLEQQTDWVNNNAFNVEILERDLDLEVMMIQQLQTDLEQGLQVSGWRGDWTNNTLYYVNDNVTDPDIGNVYVCKEEHTSNTSGTIADDIALGYWALALDVTVIKDAEQNAIDAANAAAVSEQNASASAAEAVNAAAGASQSEINAKQSEDNAEYWATQVAQSLSTVPIGHIMAWLGGYFTDSANGGFADVLGDPETYLGSFGYVPCDGREYQHQSSPIFNYPGRHLPNLTDERFLMGSTVQGQPGGANSVQGTHTHTTGDHKLTTSEMPSHSHSGNTNTTGAHSHGLRGTSSGKSTPYEGWNLYQSGDIQMNTESEGAHSHSVTIGSAGGNGVHNHGDTGEAGSQVDNRPQYLTVVFAMKVMYGAGPDLTLYLVQPENP